MREVLHDPHKAIRDTEQVHLLDGQMQLDKDRQTRAKKHGGIRLSCPRCHTVPDIEDEIEVYIDEDGHEIHLIHCPWCGENYENDYGPKECAHCAWAYTSECDVCKHGGE